MTQRMTAWRRANPERAKELRRAGNERARHRQARLARIALDHGNDEQQEADNGK